MSGNNGKQLVETIEEFHPNPKNGNIFTHTEAVLRAASGRRFLVSVLGGCHRQVELETHYIFNEILEELQSSGNGVPTMGHMTTPEPVPA